jgi:phosphatidylglycerophosphate synthase
MVNKLADEHECPLDIHMYNFINTHLHLYHKLGFTPNIVTTFSILFGLFSAQQIGAGHFELAAALLLIAYYLDCVDGKLARKYNMITKFGDYYDHAGDLLKIIVIILALFLSNKKTTTDKQWMYINLLLLLAIIQVLHLGYQEIIYDKKEESSMLNLWRKLVEKDKNPKETIQYTKYFGCGTWYLCFALLIIFWRK